MKLVRETGRRNRLKSPSVIQKSTKVGSVASMALLLGMTACGRDFTLSYVYAPSETATTSGLINAYGVDNQTGSLILLNDSPVPSGGRKPVAIVATPPDTTGKRPQALYVINHDDSTVVEFSIGTDGKIYPQNTYNTTGTGANGITSGSYPVALAISPDGNFLYVAYTYQQGYTTASPGPGGITTFAISATDRSLGAALDFPIGRAPAAIAVGSKPSATGQNIVYVAAQDSAAVNPAANQASNQTLNLFAFASDPTSGALSALPGETINAGNAASLGYVTGTAPAAIISDAAGTHLYVTDSTGNVIIPYSIGADGVPTLIPSGATGETAAFFAVQTGSGPRGMAIDPTGKFLFVANYEGTIGEYTFGPSGEPVVSTTAASTGAGTGTTCVTVEPKHGVYLYASGSLSNSITGEQLIPADGTLKPIINSPYEATTLPICTVAVARIP